MDMKQPSCISNQGDSPQANRASPMAHALSFDVEAWFHAHNLGIPQDQWSSLPMRLDKPVDTILALLDNHHVRATFFVLGWVAQKSPELVKRIHAAGHEIASHGYFHVPVTEMTPARFRNDVRLSKLLLEDLTGSTVLGYRAPSYSITQATLWALDELASLGFAYDSSVYPCQSPHGRYGLDGASLSPFRTDSGLWEYPLPTVSLFGKRLPAATGAYLRILPNAVTNMAFKQNTHHRCPVVVNIHPWELDPDQPRRAINPSLHFRHYTKLGATAGKLETLLKRYTFQSIYELHQMSSRAVATSTKRDEANAGWHSPPAAATYLHRNA